MSAWILAWIDVPTWSTLAEGDPAAMEAVGAALVDDEGGTEVGGFGRLQLDGLTLPFVESVPPRLVMWSSGELAVYPAANRSDVEAFLGDRSRGDAGPVLIFVVDWDEATRRSALEVGEAVTQLLKGAKAVDLGHSIGGVHRSDEVSWDDTVTFAWHRNSLTRCGNLSSSNRHDISETLSSERRATRAPDTPLQLTRVVVNQMDRPALDLPVELSGLMVLLGRNGAGKTTVLEGVALALASVKGIVAASERRSMLPSLSRRADDQLAPAVSVTLRAVHQEAAAELFHRLFFLFAYSPFAASDFRARMPSGLEVWDAFSAIESPDALDPRLLMERLGVAELRAAMAEAMVQSVGYADPVLEEPLRAIFDRYLSGTEVVLGSDKSMTYRPPDSSLVLEYATRVPTDDFTELINNRSTGYARDALFWALSSRSGGVANAVAGMRTYDPQTGAMYAGWERSPWTELYEDALALVRESVPATVAFNPVPDTDGINATVERLIIQLARKVLPRRDFDEAGDEHSFASPEVGPVAAVMGDRLASRATEILPPFVRTSGTIRIEIAPAVEWHRHRVRVEMVSESGAFPLTAASSGVVAWGVACLRFAATQLLLSDWSIGGEDVRTKALVSPERLTPGRRDVYPVLYLADEPEAHLHPTAIREVVDVCDGLARMSSGCIVATHALEFLGSPEMVTTPFVVDDLVVEPCPPGLPALRERAEHLGVSPAAVLMSARAVLCVEGPTDEWAMNTFAGDILDRSFVHTIRLFGMNELADRLPELDLVYSLDIPVYLLLDHVRASKLRSLLSGKLVDATKEERELHRLAQALRNRRATVAPLAKVDIVELFPTERSALRSSNWVLPAGPVGTMSSLNSIACTGIAGPLSSRHSLMSRVSRLGA